MPLTSRAINVSSARDIIVIMRDIGVTGENLDYLTPGLMSTKRRGKPEISATINSIASHYHTSNTPK
ncbi:MAG: hypothetical protein K2X93_16575 [Candidatus Obscuribacterales bacterium]|nr:hypothetical protein [Candidatus Obscuribacterales bacterium]